MFRSAIFVALVSGVSAPPACAIGTSTFDCELPRSPNEIEGDVAYLLQKSSEIHKQQQLITKSKSDRVTPLKEEFAWYHTSDALHDHFESIRSGKNKCKNAEFHMTTEALADGTKFDILRIKRGTPKVRSMLVFGEHARELITTETALTLVQMLCGHVQSQGDVNGILDNVEFIIAPNANPIMRKKVEDGHVCQRTNENSVDLNRNWSEERMDRTIPEGSDTYPGKHAFSERETQILKDIVDKDEPHIYVNVHSGTRILTYPYGFDSSAPLRENHKERMEAALRPIREKRCSGDNKDCPIGNLATKVGYLNPGCDIDYVYDKLGHKTPYVFLFEIFTGGWSASLLQEAFKTNNSLGCMSQFNPAHEDDTQKVSKNWAEAFLDLASYVDKQHFDLWP